MLSNSPRGRQRTGPAARVGVNNKYRLTTIYIAKDRDGDWERGRELATRRGLSMAELIFQLLDKEVCAEQDSAARIPI